MSAIKSLWCLFEEFGIGSTKTPLIDIFLYFHHFSAWHRVDIVKRHYVLMTNESYKVKGFTWGTCTTELARISLASGYFTVIFSITKFLRKKKKTTNSNCALVLLLLLLYFLLFLFTLLLWTLLIGTIVITDIYLHEYNSRLAIKLWNLILEQMLIFF